MTRDLTTSDVHRKNILNNRRALDSVYEKVGFSGVLFESKYCFTKKQVADFYEVDERTINRYLDNHKHEIEGNGYEVLGGKRLNDFKVIFGKDINVLTNHNEELESLRKTTVLGIFAFKAFLNIGMLLTESEQAKRLRSFILDIVIDYLNKRTGGSTKYINQREDEFLTSVIRQYGYREAFTNALDECIDPNQFKYSQLTDMVYVSIFKEKSKEYRQILKLGQKENLRATMYSEVLDLISSYENGFADYLRKTVETRQQKVRLSEAVKLFREFEVRTNAIYEPLREKARSLMASRDIAFRDALHEKLEDYVTHLSTEDYEKFLGDRSMTLEERILANIDVFKRLKDR